MLQAASDFKTSPYGILTLSSSGLVVLVVPFRLLAQTFLFHCPFSISPIITPIITAANSYYLHMYVFLSVPIPDLYW